MKAAVWTDYGKIELREVEIPEITAQEVLIKVHAAGLCRTDLEVYTGQFQYGRPPHILGHEIAGEVVKTGAEVQGWKVGDRVVVETSIGCGHCSYCLSGQRHLCESMTEIGFTPNPGGYAQYVKAPAHNLFRIPDNVSYEEAGILESVVCPVGGLMRLGVGFGETVAVYGVGPAGIAFIQGAKAMGAGKVIAIARNPKYLERVKQFGADELICTREENAADRIKELTNGKGADLACEATGNVGIMKECFQVVRRGGRILYYGLPSESDVFEFPTKALITDQISVFGVAGNPFVWEPLLQLVSNGSINLKDMVTCCLPLSQIETAFQMLEDKENKPIKIVLHPWDNHSSCKEANL